MQRCLKLLRCRKQDCNAELSEPASQILEYIKKPAVPVLREMFDYISFHYNDFTFASGYILSFCAHFNMRAQSNKLWWRADDKSKPQSGNPQVGFAAVNVYTM